MNARLWLALLVVALWAAIVVISDRAAPPPTRAVAIPVATGEAALLEAQARHLCARDRGDNAGYILLDDGVLVCTDKHGRRSGSEITIARKTTP